MTTCGVFVHNLPSRITPHPLVVVSMLLLLLCSMLFVVAQFWNIPIEYTRFTGLYGDEQVTTTDDVYAVTVRYPESPARTFLAELSPHTWSGETEPCLYAGNQLGGRSYEGRHFASVIKGRHRDYEVSSVFAHKFTFDKYDSSC